MSNWSARPTYTISEAEYLKNQNESNELTHYGVKGMKWGVRKDLAKAKLSKSFNEARYSKPIQTAVNTKVGKAAKKALYTTFDVKNFDDLAVKVGKMAGSPKGIAALAAIVVLPDPLIWTGMAAYASVKNSGVLNRRLKHEDISMNELKHYGVLGMKWGIRRYQPYPKNKHGTYLGQSRDKDIRISTGSEAYRIQVNNKLEGSGKTYVTFDQLDRLKYNAMYAIGDGVGIDVNLPQNERDAKEPYSLTLKLTNDLIAPSYTNTMNAFVKSVLNTGLNETVASLYGDRGDGPYWKRRGEIFVKAFSKRTVTEMRDKAYLMFMHEATRSSKVMNEFFSILKSEGYNALIDDNDLGLGFNVFNEKNLNNNLSQNPKGPMLVFDKSSFETVAARKVTSKDKEYFSKQYYVDLNDAFAKEYGRKLNEHQLLEKKQLQEQYSELASDWLNWAFNKSK